MAQINNTTSYPEATAPLSGDSILIGSLASGVTNNFLMSDIASFVMGANTLTLQDVCDQGSLTTTDIIVGGVDVRGDADITGTLDVAGVSTFANTTKVIGAFRLTATAPATSSSAGIPQTIAVDASYIYVCTTIDTWGRVAIDTNPF